jgi:hypothetical protein
MDEAMPGVEELGPKAIAIASTVEFCQLMHII